MHTNNKQQVTRSNQTDWKPLVEAGTRTEGVSVKFYDLTESQKDCLLSY